MAFTTIETQEQLDAIIGERINRARESTRKEYEGWISPDDFAKKTEELNGKVTSLSNALTKANEEAEVNKKALTERDSKIKAYEAASVKTRIAHELGLSYEAINFLQGEDEESIKKSAEALKSLVGSNKYVPPLKDNEPKQEKDESKDAIRNLAKAITK